MFLPLPLRLAVPAETGANEDQCHGKTQQLRAEGGEPELLPPQSAASRSSAPACSTSPRPMEMHRAERGRSTAVRKPLMRMLKPTSRYDRAYLPQRPGGGGVQQRLLRAEEDMYQLRGQAGKYRQSRPPS